MRCPLFYPIRGWVAQLAEQRTENPRVGGSIPSPAIFILTRARCGGTSALGKGDRGEFSEDVSDKDFHFGAEGNAVGVAGQPDGAAAEFSVFLEG